MQFYSKYKLPFRLIRSNSNDNKHATKQNLPLILLHFLFCFVVLVVLFAGFFVFILDNVICIQLYAR